MTTIYDCATVSDDVYEDSPALASSRGWTRSLHEGAEGFAAARYTKDGATVLAYRGTNDGSDVLEDLEMIPRIPEGNAERTIEALLEQYGLADAEYLESAPRVLENITRMRAVRDQIRTQANRVPTGQTPQAMRYFEEGPRPDFVTGHSLGGALAKVVSQRTGTRCVAFNSPFMGDLQGVEATSTMSILSMNTAGDPLSLATQAVGNLPHGPTITLAIPPPEGLRVPRRRRVNPWTHAARGPLGLGTFVGDHVSSHGEYLVALARYLGAIALHHHSMANLRRAIERIPPYRAPIAPQFANVLGG